MDCKIHLAFLKAGNIEPCPYHNNGYLKSDSASYLISIVKFQF